MELLREKLESVAIKHLTNSSLHGLRGSDIPSKKIKNIKAIHTIGDESILFLHDATLFGSAKDGMVFTDKGIYWREVLADSQKITYREVVESTAHKDYKKSSIDVLGKSTRLDAKNDYYNLIAELKLDLIAEFSLYKAYYEQALVEIEEELVAFVKEGDSKRIIDLLSEVEGIFVAPEDKSAKIREISFDSYLKTMDFTKAEQELEFLKDMNPTFYDQGALLLDRTIKEKEYGRLDEWRLNAMEIEDFKEAYRLFEEQKKLKIREDDQLEEVENEIKKSHYQSLDEDRKVALEKRDYDQAYAILGEQNAIGIRNDEEIETISHSMKAHEFDAIGQDRLQAIKNNEFDIAFDLLEKQKNMDLISEEEIGIIKISIEKAKRDTLEKYHEKLKILVDSEDFVESDQVIAIIQQIDPSYYLEKEKVLMLIYQYKLEEAGKMIGEIPQLDLKAELEDILDINARMLCEEIRNAAQNKEYDFFDFFPHVWNYVDEYGMSAHHYFALEADIKGLLKALGAMTGDLNIPNIFGHDFVDLLAFACDPGLGNKGTDLVDLLDQVKDQVNLIEIGRRLEFLTKEVFEDISREEKEQIHESRLEGLNEKLLSINHFVQIIDEMKSKEAYDPEIVAGQVAISKVKSSDDYPKKGEFETLEAYRERATLFDLEFTKDFNLTEEIIGETEDLIKAYKANDARYIPSLSNWIRVEEKQINLLEALETSEGRLALYNLYFPLTTPKLKIGEYNTEKEVFMILVDGVIKEMSVPLAIAEDFKGAFDDLEFNCHRILKDGLISDLCIYEYEKDTIILPFAQRKDFGH